MDEHEGWDEEILGRPEIELIWTSANKIIMHCEAEECSDKLFIHDCGHVNCVLQQMSAHIDMHIALAKATAEHGSD